MRGAGRWIRPSLATERVSLAVFGAIGVSAVAGILFSRATALRRAKQFVATEHVRARNADGVFTGAESIVLDGGSDRHALLLHGFNDTPQSLSHLARALNAKGWSVVVPLLPQHGRGADVLLATGNAADWLGAGRAAWTAVRKRGRHSVLIGQSMGGAIASILAAEERPSAIVLLAPYLHMSRGGRTLARVWPLWQLLVPQLRSNPERSLHDPEARARALGGGRFSPRLVAELLRIVEQARRSLDQITAPTLVINARSDYRIPPVSAQEAYELIGARDKTLIWNTRGGHVVAADLGRAEVATNVLQWLDTRVAQNDAAAGTTFDAMRKS